jgi:hypothetical protein
MFRDSTNSTIALVSLSSGQLIWVTVDDGTHALHRQDEGTVAGTYKSTATQPTLHVGGQEIDLSAETHPEFASLGPTSVNLVPGTTDQYAYYGITFANNQHQELTESWHVTFEGVIPGTPSQLGYFVDAAGTFADPSTEFCTLGVEPGDHVVLQPQAAVACGALSGTGFEYRIVSVAPRRLVLAPLDGTGAAPLPDATCAALAGPVPYAVRVSGSWTVVGSRSGFLHNWTDGVDGCVQRADADPKFTARAFTSTARNGKTIEACPPVSGEADIDWRTFQNLSFGFVLFPGCQTDQNFVTTVLPGARDADLGFQVTSGLTPLLVSVGGVPLAPWIVGTTAYIVDAAAGSFQAIDLSTQSVLGVYY